MSDPSRGHLGENEVWIPAEGTSEYEALVERLASRLASRIPSIDPHPLDVVDAVVTALRGDQR